MAVLDVGVKSYAFAGAGIPGHPLPHPPQSQDCPLFEAVPASRRDVAQDPDQHVVREVHEVLALSDIIRIFYSIILAIFSLKVLEGAIAPSLFILVDAALDATLQAADAVLSVAPDAILRAADAVLPEAVDAMVRWSLFYPRHFVYFC